MTHYIGEWVDNIKGLWNKNTANQSELQEGEWRVWSTDEDVNSPGKTYSSEEEFAKGEKLSFSRRDQEDTTHKSTVRNIRKRNIRKINGGRVIQYPIDIDTNLQDYFEIQVFRYRPAGRLPTLGSDTEEQRYTDEKMGNYSRRFNRQNLRLQDLQSTIQIPIPNSLKDMNAIGWGEQEISGLMGQLGGPTLEGLFGVGGENAGFDGGLFKNLWKAGADTLEETKALFGEGSALRQFRRRAALNAVAKAASGIGVNIDVDQAITRINGTIVNPNMELLFNGPSLRTFSFVIRFSPRSQEESERIRMIIRVLKQHSAVKKNPQISNNYNVAHDGGSNFLLGTPDVFKLRYIKAKTQKDIKGLNKFKTCALRSVSVDYTGEAARFAAYNEDSQPVTTLVTLNFSELIPIYDEDYHEFTNDDDVGL